VVTIGTGPGLPPSADLVGAFQGTPVPLGKIAVEAPTGRLVFVGGEGASDTVPSGGLLSPDGDDFADNDGWYDDTADGTVQAILRFKSDGRTETARPAWVVSGAYDFAPEVTNLVTVYDILFEMAVDNRLRSLPATVYYDQHIRPIFERLSGYQWVNADAKKKRAHGDGAMQDFLADATLGDPKSPSGAKARANILDHLREPGKPAAPKPREMPLLFSDDYPDDPSVLWLTKVQFALLKTWATNNFKPTSPTPPPVELLPDALTRLQLQSCVGRALWPGIEISIRIYDRRIFFADDPFRIQFPGAIQPGMLTQSMSLPWQSDFFDCSSDAHGSGSELYWWPAQRPNEVFPFGGAAMRDWDQDIADGDDMTRRWHRLGVVRKTGSGNSQNEIERLIP